MKYFVAMIFLCSTGKCFIMMKYSVSYRGISLLLFDLTLVID